MSWWGRVVGGTFGFMLGGPLGALMGASLGNYFDSGLNNLGQSSALNRGEPERVQMAFFTTTFALIGYVAKADGRVSRDEISWQSVSWIRCNCLRNSVKPRLIFFI